MIRRKESFGYCDYIKNRSRSYSRPFLRNVIDEMTIKEKNIIKNKYNDDVTNELIETSETIWLEPEWGFPKGRRNNNEKDLDCGLREFQEETGIELNHIQLIENINPYEELFIGSNLKSYKQKYYLAYTKDDDVDLNKFQKSEVSKIDWFDINRCTNHIRPYNVEKIKMIHSIDKTIKSYYLTNLY
jgi:8-oxo-dGTP pyrophosphatase MutT (NUDIX family)